MANAKVCDRCGCIMTELTFEEKKARKYFIGVSTQDPRYNSDMEFIDICPACYDELVKFMFEDEDE